jgi:hypothetical protein
MTSVRGFGENTTNTCENKPKVCENTTNFCEVATGVYKFATDVCETPTSICEEMPKSVKSESGNTQARVQSFRTDVHDGSALYHVSVTDSATAEKSQLAAQTSSTTADSI